jgi:hypothetical protein
MSNGEEGKSGLQGGAFEGTAMHRIRADKQQIDIRLNLTLRAKFKKW